MFVTEEFTKFRRQFGIEHITCPVRDHRGNGKIERLVRTINERLRANKQIVVTKDQSGLSKLLYALRTSEKKDGSSSFERKANGQGAELGEILLSLKIVGYFKTGPKRRIRATEIHADLKSTVLVRERTRGSKLQGAFDKKARKKMKKSAHTIIWLPESSQRPNVYQNATLP